MRDNTAWKNALLAYGITDETFALNTTLLKGHPAKPGYLAAAVTVMGTVVAGIIAMACVRLFF